MTYKITQEDHELSENFENEVYQTAFTQLNEAEGEEEALL